MQGHVPGPTTAQTAKSQTISASGVADGTGFAVCQIGPITTNFQWDITRALISCTPTSRNATPLPSQIRRTVWQRV